MVAIDSFAILFLCYLFPPSTLKEEKVAIQGLVSLIRLNDHFQPTTLTVLTKLRSVKANLIN